jgi:hypothetical protein
MAKSKRFFWPDGKRAALSITFDDARLSQVDRGIPILDAHGVKASFYVTPAAVEKRLDGWRRAVANGHEIGNHTMTHPCTGNFRWSRNNALEDYTLERMREEIITANRVIQKQLGVCPTTFAYPCGQRFVGRGTRTKSYVPVVAKHFLAGRGYPDETPGDPTFCDLAQLSGFSADGASFARVRSLCETALASGGWLVLVAHEVGQTAPLTIAPRVLEALCRYAQNPRHGLWVNTVAAIAQYVAASRAK